MPASSWFAMAMLTSRRLQCLPPICSDPSAASPRATHGPATSVPDLSRGFRALKTWMTIATLGADRIGDAMLANCELAQYLAQKVRQSALFELKAPVALNIVCFGVRGARDRAFSRELVLDMHETGIAAPSWTTIGGESVVRCAIVNHRTTRADIDRMMDAMTGLALSRSEAGASR